MEGFTMSYLLRVSDHFRTYVGIDLHTTSLTVTAIPQRGGAFVRQGIPTHCRGRIGEFFLGLARPVCVGIESMGSFYWLWDMLLPVVNELILVDALDLSKLAPREAKTDPSMSAKIAYVLRDGKIPAAYVPAKHIRHLRQLGRQWHRLTEVSTTTKTRIRWQLHQNNRRGPRAITGASLHRWMEAHGHELDETPSFLIHTNESILLDIERIRSELRREMKTIIAADPILAHWMEILTSTPGIGDILGTIIAAEFGNFERFRNADAVACWTGLTERSHVSNRQAYPGKISKAGSPTLRWALCEAAFQLTCSDETYHQMYQNLEAKTGCAGKARTAMGRRIARYLWKMIVSDTPFRRGESRKRTQRANTVRLRRKRRKQRTPGNERNQAVVTE
jgi:transposase